MGQYVRLTPDRQVKETISASNQYEQKLIWLYTDDDSVQVGQYFLGNEFTYESKLDEVQGNLNDLVLRVADLEKSIPESLPEDIKEADIDLLFGSQEEVGSNEVMFSPVGIFVGSNIILEGTRVIITSPGEYILRGSGIGSIEVTSPGVTLNLNGLSLTSDVKNTFVLTDTTIISEKSSVRNIFSEDCSVFVADSLILEGNLSIESLGLGIQSDFLEIRDASLSIKSAGTSISSYVIEFNNSNIRIETLADGIISESIIGDSSVDISAENIGIETSSISLASCWVESSNISISASDISSDSILLTSPNSISGLSGKYVEFSGISVLEGSRISIRTVFNTLVCSFTSRKEFTNLVFRVTNLADAYRLYVDNILVQEKSIIGGE